ncbi:MAG: tetratricopeptide repeat protein [bacterium]|nr:tetratricopeptide repeat protein [bacterium]
MNRLIPLFYSIIIISVCLIGYGSLYDHPWSYDDLDHIEAAKRAQQDWTEIFNPSAKEPTRWVLNIYFWIAHVLFGDHPGGYHAFNVLLHTINSLLCAHLLRRLFERPFLAGISGFLFAINGTPYEAIYEISAAGLLIGTGFILLSIGSVKNALETRQTKWIYRGAAWYALAILSYESLAVAILPVFYLWWTENKAEHRSLLLPLTYVVILCGFVLVDTLYYQTVTGKIGFNAIDLGWHAAYNLSLFSSRLLINAYLTPFGWDAPPPFDIPPPFFDLYAITGIAVIGILIFLSLRSNIIRFASIWSISTLLPYIFGSQNFYFPRYWYLATIGSALLFSHALLWLSNRLPKPGSHLLLILGLGCLSWLGLEKIRHYEGRFLTHAANFHIDHRQDANRAIELFERARNHYQIHLPMLYQNLATAYFEAGALKKARERVEIVIQKRPNYANGHRLLGRILFLQDQYTEAIQAFRRAGQNNPNVAADLHISGDELIEKGHLVDALAAYREVLDIHPDYEYAHVCLLNIGKILHQLKNIQPAADALSLAIQIKPDFVDAHRYLGFLLFESGNPADAIQAFHQALKHRPDDVKSLEGLAKIQEHIGNLDP